MIKRKVYLSEIIMSIPPEIFWPCAVVILVVLFYFVGEAIGL